MAHWLVGRGGSLVFVLALLSLGTGCKELFESGVDDGFKDEVAGKGVGETCSDTKDCRDGLECQSDGTQDVCTFARNTPVGEPCIYTEQCDTGLYCDHTRTCQSAGSVPAGGDCTTNDDCARGTICVLAGLAANCVEAADADIGDACTTNANCFAGLVCQASTDGSICSAANAAPMGSPALPPIPFWAGEECGDDDTTATAYFEVPRGGAELPDFYRLPFPNNIRMKDGHIDLTGHPAPPSAIGVEIIEDYLAAAETVEGFSTNPIVLFRFSEAYDWMDVRGNILLVDITEGSSTYGQTVPLHWLTTSGSLSKYICRNWLAFAPGVGTTLRPGITYAAIVKDAVRTNDDQPFARDTDLNALLGSTAPGNADLAAAHTKYAPLRAWLADPANAEVTADDVLNATVFTTHDPTAVMPKLREAVRADDMPTLSDVTVCGSGTTSPCADDTDQRNCSPVNDAFTEIHGRISLPIFQHGTAPYETAEQGGGIELDSDGTPTIARHEDVCFALTIPKTAIPTEGFPLMLFAHGTSGSFTNAVRNGLAEDVADDATSAAATLAIDLPQHGARRGSSTRDSDELFYNFINPDAARDNVTQGSADLITLVRWAASFTQDSGATGGEIRFNPGRIGLFAHSQGATHASLMFPYEPDLDMVLLSGNGGHLTTSLLTKENPVNIKAVLPFAMLDVDGNGNLAGDEFHPMLALFQTYFDRVDPLNFARLVQTERSSLAPNGQHVFMTYGLGDTYSTEGTMHAYARAAGLAHVTPVLANLALPERDAPLTGNATLNSVARTVGIRQYEPSTGEDGHFVSTDTGYSDVLNFVRQALSGMVPSIGE